MQQRRDLRLSGRTVEDVFSPAARLHKAGVPQNLQVPGCVREAYPGPCGQLFDRSFALTQHFKQFESVCVTQCLRDVRQAFENPDFRSTA
jgi:hypothetical protein